jgi:hypothetical protein
MNKDRNFIEDKIDNPEGFVTASTSPFPVEGKERGAIAVEEVIKAQESPVAPPRFLSIHSIVRVKHGNFLNLLRFINLNVKLKVVKRKT